MEVERTGSITQAAENLYMAQPNLSKAIKELETSIGITIFERTLKGMVPTDKGCEFLDLAKSVLSNVDKMQLLSETNESVHNSLRVSVPKGSFLTRAFYEIALSDNIEKNTFISFLEVDFVRIVRNIVRGTSNVGIIQSQSEYWTTCEKYLTDRKIKFEALREYTRLPTFSERDAMYFKESSTLHDLTAYTELIRNDIIYPFSPSNEVQYTKDSATSKNRLYVNDSFSQIDILSKNTGIYMMLQPLSKSFLKNFRLIQRPLSTIGLRYLDALIYREDYSLSYQDRSFISNITSLYS